MVDVSQVHLHSLILKKLPPRAPLGPSVTLILRTLAENGSALGD